MIFQRFRNQSPIKLIQRLLFATRVRSEHYRLFGDEYKLIGVYETHNDITNEGKNDILAVYFKDGTQTASTSWYIGLISLAGYTSLAPTDVMNSHAGWAEFVGYTQSTRPAWGPGTPASQTITNATAVQFDINAAGTIKGIFITTNNTKSGTTGKLWATALYTGDVPVAIGDQIRTTYTLSC